MMITHSIQRSQLRNRVNSQMMFNSIMRDRARQEAGIAPPENSVTNYTKGASTVIDELLKTAGEAGAQDRAAMEANLAEFERLLGRYQLPSNDYANGLALATAINYLSYRGENYLDQKGLQLTANMLRYGFQEDTNFREKTDREKQDEIETLAIAAIDIRAIQPQDPARAKVLAAKLLQHTLDVDPAQLTFGSGGFFTTEKLTTTSERVKKIDTSFKWTEGCLSCTQFAINDGGTAADYNRAIQSFRKQLAQKGKSNNDLLDMLTESFARYYHMAKQGYTLNERQRESARKLILEGFSNPEDQVLRLEDQRKQIIYEEYVIDLLRTEDRHQAALEKQRKGQSGDPLDRAWDLAASTYDPNSPEKITEHAEARLGNILYPISLRDYVLTQNGFLHR